MHTITETTAVASVSDLALITVRSWTAISQMKDLCMECSLDCVTSKMQLACGLFAYLKSNNTCFLFVS